MTTRIRLRDVASRALTAVGAPRVARWARRESLVVLTYHNIVEHPADAARGEASLHVDRASFAVHLDLLRETHDVVSLADVLSGTRPIGGRPRVLITFDDAYQGALTLGVDELVRRRIPAVFFVAPGFVDGRTFWWDELAGGYGGVMPKAVREAALVEHRGVETRIREWIGRNALPVGKPTALQRCATMRELIRAARAPGITFGAHSWSHPVLAAVDAEVLADELCRPLVWLRKSFNNVVPALAVPYGVSSPRVESEARAHGYVAVFGGRRGWVPSPITAPFMLPRENVPGGITRHGFLLRSSGVTG
jgi:peptidoglycan/xylan/chitin deacetylase (PgdA/CDA1 family)